jgi:hypothetical protein
LLRIKKEKMEISGDFSIYRGFDDTAAQNARGVKLQPTAGNSAAVTGQIHPTRAKGGSAG